MTVPHGLRSGYRRDEARRQLVEQLAATDDGRAFVDGLRSIEDAYEWELLADELVTRLAVTSYDALPHRREKLAAIGRERERRRLAQREPDRADADAKRAE